MTLLSLLPELRGQAHVTALGLRLFSTGVLLDCREKAKGSVKALHHPCSAFSGMLLLTQAQEVSCGNEKAPEVPEVCSSPEVWQVQGLGVTPRRKRPWVSWVLLPPLSHTLMSHILSFCLDPAPGATAPLPFDLGRRTQECGVGIERVGFNG